MGNAKSSSRYKRVLVPFTEEQLANVFKSHDRDGDGKLTKEELRQAFNYLGSTFTSFRVKEALRAADANGDGFITMDEMNNLIQYAKSRKYALC